MRREASPTIFLRNSTPLNRLFGGVFLCLLLSAPALAQVQRDPIEAAFAAVPFPQWVADGPKAELPWHPRITAPTLTLHQRIAVQVGVRLDGKELTKRCCEGGAVALLEIEDNQGRTYRNYGEKNLSEALPGLRQSMVELSWRVFLLPGDYKATIAFYYSGRNGHSLVTQTIHVEPLKHDPLAESWRDLPAVEFWDAPPEGLGEIVLPYIKGRLELPVKGKSEIHLEILENLTPYPSERRKPALYQDRLGVFLPILKSFAQIQIPNGWLSFSLLNFARRRVIFEQHDIQERQVSWPKLESALTTDRLGAVDVHDLQREDELGSFFRGELTRRLEEANGEAKHVLVVISGPMDLGAQLPIEVSPQARGKLAVFYLECKFLQTPVMERHSNFFGEAAEPSEQSKERWQDGVGKALKDLNPIVFAVDSAEGVREAMAAILRDVSQM